MKIDNAEKLVQLQMMSQIFKSAVGESGNFQLIMESLMKAMDEDASFSNLINSATSQSNAVQGGNAAATDIQKSIMEQTGSGNVTIDQAVDWASKKYGVEKDFINAIIKQESSFNPNSTSHAGAMGLMQLMPGTARELGISNAYDVVQNVDGGTRYMKQLLNKYGNSKELALAAYNAGMGTLKKRSVDTVEEISKLPNETKDYVKKVMKYYGK